LEENDQLKTNAIQIKSELAEQYGKIVSQKKKIDYQQGYKNFQLISIFLNQLETIF